MVVRTHSFSHQLNFGSRRKSHHIFQNHINEYRSRCDLTLNYRRPVGEKAKNYRNRKHEQY